MVQPVSFVSLASLADPAVNLAVVPAQVASLQRVPPALLIAPVTDATIVTYEDGTTLAVVGTVAATLAALNGASVGSSLVLLPSLADPAVNLAIQGARVSGLTAIAAALLIPPVVAATRVLYEDGTTRNVVGTVAATAAALAVATPAPPSPGSFAAQFLFQIAVAGAFSTVNAALTLAPGSVITIPAGGAGNWLIQAIAYMATSNIANGVQATIRKNGGALGQLLTLAAGSLAVGDSAPFVGIVFDNPAVGDTFDLAIAANPGGGADTADASGIIVSGFKTN